MTPFALWVCRKGPKTDAVCVVVAAKGKPLMRSRILTTIDVRDSRKAMADWAEKAKAV